MLILIIQVLPNIKGFETVNFYSIVYLGWLEFQRANEGKSNQTPETSGCSFSIISPNYGRACNKWEKRKTNPNSNLRNIWIRGAGWYDEVKWYRLSERFHFEHPVTSNWTNYFRNKYFFRCTDGSMSFVIFRVFVGKMILWEFGEKITNILIPVQMLPK